MKKFLLASAAVILVLAIAVLIAPQFINWNLYKSEITTAVRDATGRELKIDGDIEVTVLPSLALKVSKVRFANVAGAKTKDMLVLDDVRVSVALGDLIQGKLGVILTLVKPVVALEVTPDGKASWDMGPAGAPVSANGKSAPPGKFTPSDAASAPLDIRLDSFRIENGSLTYLDGRTGMLERIRDLNSEVSFDSLAGPFRLKGDAGIRGYPLSFEIATGKLDGAKPVALSATVGLKQGGGTVALNGAVTDPTGTPGFEGKIHAQSANLATVLAALAGTAPAVLARNLDLAGKVKASPADVTLSDLALQFGTVRATGAAALAFSGAPKGTVRLRAESFDLDALLRQKAASPDKKTPAPKADKSAGKGGSPKAGKGTPASAPAPGFALPADVDITLDALAKVVKYRGKPLRQASAKIRLAQGQVNLQQIGVLLPGNASAGLAGTVQAVKGKPYVNVRVVAKSDELRGLLKWLDAEPEGISSARLRRFSVETILQGTPDNLQAHSLKAKLDSTNIQGGLTLVLGPKPAFGLRVAADRLNLDSYMPTGRRAAVKKAPKAKSKAGPAGKSKKPAKTTSTRAVTAGADVLSRFNANIVASVGSLTFKKQPVRKLKADLSILNGVVTVKSLNIADFAGVAAAFSGRLNKPDAKQALTVNFNATVNDSKRLFRLFGAPPPSAVRRVGKISAKGTMSGDFEALAVNSTVSALGGAAKLNGRLRQLLSNPNFDLGIGLQMPETSRLIQLTDPGYRPAGGKIGPLALSFRAAGTPRKVTLDQLKGTVGPTTVDGALGAELAGDVPKLTANLKLGALDLDRLKSRAAAPAPRSRNTGRGQTQSRAAATSRPPRDRSVGRGVHPRWSRDRFDVAALKGVNANFTLAVASLKTAGLQLANLSLQGSLDKGVLDLAKLQAGSFGGTVSGSARLDAAAKVPSFSARLSADRLPVNQVVPALNKLRMNFGPFRFGGRIGGTVSLSNLQVSARGASEAAMVSSLGGQGQINGVLNVALSGETKTASAAVGVAGVLLGKRVKGLQPLTQVTETTNRLISYFSRAPNKFLGDFTIRNGTVSSNNLQVIGRDAVLLTAGSAAMAPWRVDSNSQVIETGREGAPLLTAAVRGDIEQPQVKVGGAWLQGSRAAPQAQQAPAQQSPGGGWPVRTQPSQQQPQQQQQPVLPKPKDILKGLFGR